MRLKNVYHMNTKQNYLSTNNNMSIFNEMNNMLFNSSRTKEIQ